MFLVFVCPTSETTVIDGGSCNKAHACSAGTGKSTHVLKLNLANQTSVAQNVFAPNQVIIRLLARTVVMGRKHANKLNQLT